MEARNRLIRVCLLLIAAAAAIVLVPGCGTAHSGHTHAAAVTAAGGISPSR